MKEPLPAPAAATNPSEDDVHPELAVTTPFVHHPPSSADPQDVNSWQLPPRYRVVGEIGRGGMGVVLRAIDLDIQRPLAVKVMRHVGDAASEERLLEESRITGQLQHPGIPPVHETGRLADGRPFFSMKLIDGRTLWELLKARHADRPDLPRFLKLFEQITQTIAYAHSQGVIHRDLKPPNVMVGAFGEVQVMDWGLAKRLGSGTRPQVPTRAGSEGSMLDSAAEEAETLLPFADTDQDHRTHEGQILGTPAYMPPEQARGELARLDERCDVFSLGAILCEILTGRPPYVGRDKQEVYRRATTADLADAQKRLAGSGADAALIALAEDCLAAEPDGRPRQAGMVAQRVADYLASVQQRLQESLVAQAEAGVKTGEERKRRKLAMFLAAAVAVLLLGAVSAGLWYANDQARRRQEESQRSAAFTEKQDRLNHDVAELLDEAERLRKDFHSRLKDPRQAALLLSELHHWQSLLASAQAPWKRAETLAASSRDMLSSSVQTRLKTMGDQFLKDEQDRQLAFELDRIRLESSALINGKISLRSTAEQMSELLRKSGYDGGDSEELLAARVEKSPIRVPLIVAFDYWALTTPDDRLREHLFAVARRVDPNPWRDRFRQLDAWNDAARLQTLASEVDLRQESPLLIAGLAQRLRLIRGNTTSLLRSALVYHPRDFWLAFELGVASNDTAEQAGAFRAALAVRPNAAVAHYNLGVVFHNQQKLAEARDCYRRATELDPNYAAAYNNLGLVLEALDRTDEAYASYRKAIQVAPNDSSSYINLGAWLQAHERLDEAVFAYRQALEIDPSHGAAWNNLGTVQRNQQKLDDAVVSFRKALAINPRHAMAWCNLGHTLTQQAILAEGLEAMKRGHEIGSREANWSHPSAEWIQEAERRIALDQKLPAILSGEVAPVDAKEQFALGELCMLHRKRYAAAARFFKAAFAADTAISLAVNARYNAACTASLAASGKGIDAAELTDEDKGALCRDALTWLQAELEQCRQQLVGQDANQHKLAVALLQQSVVDPDLAPFRDPAFVARLREEDQSAWQQFWRDVEELKEYK
ncbi:MAG: protein kinase domain-containing protein [Pirellulaceae bacterium]